jgi:hypothetical protein
MQKVVGSNPISRFGEAPPRRGFSLAGPYLGGVAYTNTEGREQLMALLGEAVEQLSGSLASLGDAYEQVDDQTADRLEESLFGPVQRAYGRAKKTYTDFAGRHGVPPREFEETGPPPTAHSARDLIEAAAEAAGEADHTLQQLQDEPALLEVGDVELRSGVAGVREAVGVVPQQTRELLRTLGR